MSKYSRLFSALAAAFIIFSCSFHIHAKDSVPVALSTSAEAAILIECSSGDVIYELNADERLPMASTTKIMTALVVIETCGLDEVVSVPEKAVGVEGSSLYLKAGEYLTVRELLYGLLLQSANDAAAALAIYTAGSVEAFASLMNERAEKLCCVNTHFTNPHGLDDEEHYTTARELAMIAAYALENETFREIVSTKQYEIPDGEGGVRILFNLYRLLREDENVIGVKTGYTMRSGRCLVSAAERDGVRVIAVTLSDPNDWNDHRKMLSYGLDAYENRVLAAAGSLPFAVSVTGGKESFATVNNEKGVSLILPAGYEEFTMSVELDAFYFAPISRGEVLGRAIWYRENGEVAAEVELIAQNDVPAREKQSLLDKIFDKFGD